MTAAVESDGMEWVFAGLVAGKVCVAKEYIPVFGYVSSVRVSPKKTKSKLKFHSPET